MAKEYLSQIKVSHSEELLFPVRVRAPPTRPAPPPPQFPLIPPGWQDFHSWQYAQGCFKCHSKFDILRRRHHCRQCGSSVCVDCWNGAPRTASHAPHPGCPIDAPLAARPDAILAALLRWHLWLLDMHLWPNACAGGLGAISRVVSSNFLPLCSLCAPKPYRVMDSVDLQKLLEEHKTEVCSTRQCLFGSSADPQPIPISPSSSEVVCVARQASERPASICSKAITSLLSPEKDTPSSSGIASPSSSQKSPSAVEWSPKANSPP